MTYKYGLFLAYIYNINDVQIKYLFINSQKFNKINDIVFMAYEYGFYSICIHNMSDMRIKYLALWQ